MNPILSRLLSNKHTLVAGIIYALFAKVIPGIGTIWFPHFADQFKATAEQVEQYALIYAMMMSGESSKTLKSGDAITTSSSGDTVILTKPEVKPTEPTNKI